MKKIVISSFIVLAAGVIAPKVQAGGAWEINKKSYALTCSSVTVKGTTNAPFVGIKVWGAGDTKKLLVSNVVATAGDTSNAQVAAYTVSTKFAPQPNGTPIHVQVSGYFTATQPVIAPPINITVACVDPNATPTPSPTTSVSPSPSPVASPQPVVAATPLPVETAPQTHSWWAKIWQFLTGWMKRQS